MTVSGSIIGALGARRGRTVDGVRSRLRWLRTPLSSAVIQTAFVPPWVLTQLGELSGDRRALYGTVL